MSKKTVIAMAVAGALSVPLGTWARDSADVPTPVTVNEAGDARVQRQHDRLMRDHHAFIQERDWEVRTPLSIPEAGAADTWSRGSAHERLRDFDRSASLEAPSGMTMPESSSFSEPMAAQSFDPSSLESRGEALALADAGVYSDYYLIGVPQDARTDYYLVEVQPQIPADETLLLVPIE